MCFCIPAAGDAQSTDGTEPSHKHTRTDLSCTRGYETWLIAEAKNRNPSIKTYSLAWGTPVWVGNGSYYSSEGVSYMVDFARCVKQVTGATLDYHGLWNEKPQVRTSPACPYRNS